MKKKELVRVGAKAGNVTNEQAHTPKNKNKTSDDRIKYIFSV